MNLLKVLRVAIIADSVVTVFKLVFAIILIDHGVNRKLKFDESEKYDNAAIAEIGIVLQFILTGALLILIFLRLMANYYHYQNEQGFHKRNVRDSSCCGCLCFAQYIIGIVITLFLWFWTQIFTQEIAGTTAIVFVCWDVVMLCVLFELLLSKSTYPLAQYEETGEGNENLYFKVEIL